MDEVDDGSKIIKKRKSNEKIKMYEKKHKEIEEEILKILLY